MAKFVIRYRGILTYMFVTGFSDPIDVGADDLERSVKASNRIADAMVFTPETVDEAFELTRRCHQSAKKMEVED